MQTYYRLIPCGNEKTTGVLHSPDDWPYPIAWNGRPVKNWNENLVLELKDGKYCPFDNCTGCANVVDEDLKKLFESYIGDDPNVEFYPVPAVSKEYGNRQYYILHFKEVLPDTIYKERSVYNLDNPIKIALKYEKVKDLKVFSPHGNKVVVCSEIAAEMKRRKLDFGTAMVPVGCYKVGE